MELLFRRRLELAWSEAASLGHILEHHSRTRCAFIEADVAGLADARQFHLVDRVAAASFTADRLLFMMYVGHGMRL